MPLQCVSHSCECQIPEHPSTAAPNLKLQMLVAHRKSQQSSSGDMRRSGTLGEGFMNRVEAVDASRSEDYICPDCGRRVILKRGRVVVAHFAHWRVEKCRAHQGETLAHLRAKRLFADVIRERGVRVDLEYSGPFVPKGRRADLLVHPPHDGTPVAIEIQHSALSLGELEARAHDYAEYGLAQIWIPFLAASVINEASLTGKGRKRHERYAPRRHELWIHALSRHEGVWMFEPEAGQLWRATLLPGKLQIKEALWYEMGAVKHYRAPGEKLSKRYRTLDLEGPFHLEDLLLTSRWRQGTASGGDHWPAGRVADFIVREGHY